MEIKFEKLNGVYVAEFEITSNCNIHIEREDLGMFTIESRGSKSGKYVPMENGYYGDKYTIDVDMLGNIYPKYIKIISVSKPTYAEVNFAEQGGGNIEYYKIDENFLSTITDDSADIFTMFPNLFKNSTTGYVIISPFAMFMTIYPDITTTEILTLMQGVALFPDVRVMIEGMEITFNDALEMMGIDISKWQKITEEEFYN